MFLALHMILDVEYDNGAMDHDDILRRILQIWRKVKIKHRLLLFQVCKHLLLQEASIQAKNLIKKGAFMKFHDEN